MKLLAISIFVLTAIGASAQITYTVTPFYDFDAAGCVPSGITVSPDGRIFVAGTFTNGNATSSIQELISIGGVREQASLIAGGFYVGMANGTGRNAQFNGPVGLASDDKDNIYVAESVNKDVRMVTAAGVVTTLSGANGSTTAFGTPGGVAWGAQVLYITDVAGSQVLQYVSGAAPLVLLSGSSLPSTSGTPSVLTGNIADGSYAGQLDFVVSLPGSSGGTGQGGVAVAQTNGNNLYQQLFLFPPESSYVPNTPITYDGAGNLYMGVNGILYLANGAGPIEMAAFGPIIALAADAVGHVYVAYVDAGNVGHIALVTPSQGIPTPTPTPTPTPNPTPTAAPATGPAVHLINLSNRGYVGTGANIAIAGFVVGGSSGSEQVLIRGIGPALSQFGVTGVLAQPVLTLFNGAGTQIAQNIGWTTNSNVPQIISVLTLTGAFALPGGSADSALLVTLQPGAYTAQVSGLNNTTGVALVEVYEVPTPTPTPTPTP